jgi:hypothetical protein
MPRIFRFLSALPFQTYKIQHLSLLDPPFPLSKMHKIAFWSYLSYTGSSIISNTKPAAFACSPIKRLKTSLGRVMRPSLRILVTYRLITPQTKKATQNKQNKKWSIYQSFQGSSSIYSFSERMELPFLPFCFSTSTRADANCRLVTTGTLNSTACRRMM